MWSLDLIDVRHENDTKKLNFRGKYKNCDGLSSEINENYHESVGT